MKKSSWTLTQELTNLTLDRVTIPRAVFESLFTPTKNKVTFTFNGWDGKSYDGESRSAKILTCRLQGYEEFKFIKVGKAVHMIDENTLVLEKATGEKNPSTHWIIDVAAKTK